MIPTHETITPGCQDVKEEITNLEDDEELIEPQWTMEECGFLDPEVQRTIRQTIEGPQNYPTFGWVDITNSFFSACSELRLGELAQDAMFGLFEAMSAIEIMDPKMDVGMGYNKHDSPPHTFESAVEAGVLKLQNLTPEEMIGIMDALFTCLVSWFDGNSMDLVLFTCLYLHAPSKIKDKGLRAFVNAVRNLITIIKNIIILNGVNEEEDIQLYGNSSLLQIEDYPISAVGAHLKDAEDDLVKHSRTLEHPEDLMAVVHRLRFMRHFYQSIFQLDSVISNSSDEHIINDIYRNLNTSIELVPQLKKTIEKGTQPQRGVEFPNPMGFTSRVHDRSQPPSFPRNIKIRDRPSSLTFLEELVQRLKYACRVIKLRDYYSIMNFFVEFSRRAGHCIVSRSILQGLFISNRLLVFGTIPMKDFLRESIRVVNSPPVLNSKHPLASDPKTKLIVDQFFRYCVKINSFTTLIRSFGFNQARQRERLPRFLQTFDSIQVEATRVDSELNMLAQEKSLEGNEFLATSLKHSTQFGTWSLYICFKAMWLYLISGFELELYSVHEYLYIYWYPYDLLIGFIVSALTRTENNLIMQEEYAEQLQKSRGGSNNAGKGNRKSKPKKHKKQQKPYRQEILYYHGLLSMCGGFYKGIGALTKDGRIRQPMSKFDSEEIRYSRRFAPFSMLTTPPPVAYEEFKSIRQHMMKPTSAEIYTIAAKHFDQARNAFESIQNPEQEILDMIQVAKINFVVMNVLAKGHQKDSKNQPEFDFSKHRYFPIIKLH